MKKNILIIGLFAILSVAQGQDYKTSVGARLGGYWDNGITLKHFIKNGTAVEGILSSRYRGYSITGLYEVQKAIKDVDGLFWYIGAGAHIGQYNYSYWGRWNYSNQYYTVIGVDGIIGLEYVFEELPLNVSLDWKPAFNLINPGPYAFWPDGGALSVRYIFK